MDRICLERQMRVLDGVCALRFKQCLDASSNKQEHYQTL